MGGLAGRFLISPRPRLERRAAPRERGGRDRWGDATRWRAGSQGVDADQRGSGRFNRRRGWGKRGRRPFRRPRRPFERDRKPLNMGVALARVEKGRGNGVVTMSRGLGSPSGRPDRGVERSGRAVEWGRGPLGGVAGRWAREAPMPPAYRGASRYDGRRGHLDDGIPRHDGRASGGEIPGAAVQGVVLDRSTFAGRARPHPPGPHPCEHRAGIRVRASSGPDRGDPFRWQTAFGTSEYVLRPTSLP